MTDAITREERAAIRSLEPDALLDALDPSAQYLQRAAKNIEAALVASEAEVERLQGRERSLLDVIDAIYLYANDTLSGRADGGPDDRDWQRAAVIEIRNRARQFATVQGAVDARAALTGEKK